MRKTWASKMLAMALTGVTVMGSIPAYTVYAAPAEQQQGTTYYVSSLHGDDANDGKSENQAFASVTKINDITLGPGDKVLLEKGSVFTDQYLHVQGSGSAEAPIEISTYGEGNRPRIDANGTGVWYQDYGNHLDNTGHKWQGNVSSTILLKDVEYIEISGLELTNDRETSKEDDGLNYNDANVMDRTGVAGVAKDKGTVDHIVLDDLYVHDVDGNVINKHMANGGIYFIVEKPTDESVTGASKFNDLTIENCSVVTTNRWGIAAAYTYAWAELNTAHLNADALEKYASSNVVIQNNYIKAAGGDAITTMYVDQPLVQYNVAEDCSRQMNPTDYPSGWQRVAAGIWPWKCKDSVFQYNECYNNQYAYHGNGDGQAWDADWTDGTLYQYNYSHGNSRGAIMFCGAEAVNTTFRYNISQNELTGPLDLPGNPDAHIYNNTFYMNENITSIFDRTGGNAVMENNIFYYDGKTPLSQNWYPGGTIVYDNNLYYNFANTPSGDENAVVVSAGTKVLEDAGSGPSANASGKAYINTDATVFDGYKLPDDSPAVNAGKKITDNNGYVQEHDFFGHALTSVPEIGAAESDVVSLKAASHTYEISDQNGISGLAKNTTVEKLLKNLIIDSAVEVTVKSGDKVLAADDVVKGGDTIVLTYNGQSVEYTIVANTDKELKETVYMVSGKTIDIPATEKNPTTVGEVLQNVSVHETANAAVVSDGKVMDDTAQIADGMTLRITAEDGTTNEYTIAVKNDYHWVANYVNAQQGNVWFGQIKYKDTDAWTNMTTYDKDWPNWQVNTYYGPGVDAPSHAAAVSVNNIQYHGLISSPPKSTISTAMAYRAPKSGVISFKIRNTDSESRKEPYLRQNGNNPDHGTLTLNLMHNDEVLHSVTLAKSFETGEWPDEVLVQVEAGDYIRVTATANGNPERPSAHITPMITYVDDTEAPVVSEKDVTATDVTTDSAVINWEAATDNVGVVGYNVYVNGEKVNDELITDTTYTLTNLIDNKEYNVEITAVDAAGNESEKSAAATFTTVEIDRVAPSVPGEVTATDITETDATISWTASTDNVGVAGYDIYVDGQKQNTELVTDTTYTLSGLKRNTSYNVEVYAFDERGNRSEAGVLTFKTIRIYPDGLASEAAEDGKYYYYKDGKVAEDVTTVAGNENGWFYVENGVVNSDYTGFASNDAGDWYVEKGQVTFAKNNILQDTTGKLGEKGAWYYVVGSNVKHIDTVAANEYGWFKITNGKVDFDYTGIAANEYGWWRIVNGAVDFNCNSVESNEHGWFKISGGAVDFNYTGIAPNQYGWWRIVNGAVDFNCNSVEHNEYGWFKISGGAVDFNYTGVAKNQYGWWMIENGAVNFKYTGLVRSESGWWYVKNGCVDFSNQQYLRINGKLYKVID